MARIVHAASRQLMAAPSGPAASAEVRRRPGGRATRVRESVLRATLRELSATSYASLSLPAVARQAGVSPSTVYRRWQTKAELVADAMLLYAEIELPVPDTGSLRGDLRSFARDLDRLLAEPRLKPMLISLTMIDDQTSDEFRRSFWNRRISATSAIVNRAVARGELPRDTAPIEMIEAVASPLWLRRLITGAEVSAAFRRRLVDRVIRAFAD